MCGSSVFLVRAERGRRRHRACGELQPSAQGRLRAADPSRDRAVPQTTARKPVLGSKLAERPCRPMRASASGRLRPAALCTIQPSVRRPLRGRTMPQTMTRNLYSGGSLRRDATFTKRAFAAESCGPPRSARFDIQPATDAASCTLTRDLPCEGFTYPLRAFVRQASPSWADNSST